jgi:hypothetical protein
MNVIAGKIPTGYDELDSRAAGLSDYGQTARFHHRDTETQRRICIKTKSAFLLNSNLG